MGQLILPEAHIHQKEILNSYARFRVVACGRRFGKTTLGERAILIRASEKGQAFLRTFARAKEWVQQTAAPEIARVEKSYFDSVPIQALERAIAAYQKLGCWLNGIGIPKPLYEQAVDVFLHCGAIHNRHPFEEVVSV